MWTRQPSGSVATRAGKKRPPPASGFRRRPSHRDHGSRYRKAAVGQLQACPERGEASGGRSLVVPVSPHQSGATNRTPPGERMVLCSSTRFRGAFIGADACSAFAGGAMPAGPGTAVASTHPLLPPGGPSGLAAPWGLPPPGFGRGLRPRGGRRPYRHAARQNQPDSSFLHQVQRACESALRGYAENRSAKLLVSDGPQARNGLPGVRRAIGRGSRRPTGARTDGSGQSMADRAMEKSSEKRPLKVHRPFSGVSGCESI